MEEKLNTQVLAHKLGLEMPGNAEQPDSAQQLKSEVQQSTCSSALVASFECTGLVSAVML